MPKSSKQVFISYARDSNAGPARALATKLGRDVAFLDEQDITLLEEFPSVLTDALLASHVVVAFVDATYFERWYCLREWMLARAPWLAARKRGGDTRLALEHMILVLPDVELARGDRARLPTEAVTL